jgi:hypothetical protein
MGAVERLFFGVVLVSSLSAVGCAAGEVDDVGEDTQTASARSTTPRKVFRGSTAKPTFASAIDERTTNDGTPLPVPLPVEDDLPLPPVPGEE